MRLIDSHCHLDFPAFDQDRAAVIAHSHALGVEKMIVVGVTRQHWSRVWDTVNNNAGLYGAFGLHPYFNSYSCIFLFSCFYLLILYI